MTTQYNQGAPMYNNSITNVIQIPSFVVSTSSNSYQNLIVPEENIIKIFTNPASSMRKMSSFTTTIDEINQNTISSVATWNANHPKQQLTIQSLLPPINRTVNYFENGNQVMDFKKYGNLFFSNGSKITQPNYYYNYVASLNINALTYANSASNYNPICLSSLVTNQICTNYNIGISSLNDSLLINLNNNLKNYTNLNNLIGSYHCLDIESLYNQFVGVGYIKYNLDHNNTYDNRPNVYGGVLIQLINRYKIYVSVPNIVTPTSTTYTSTPIPGIDNYLIQLDVAYIVYISNLVSQSQLNSNLSQSNILTNETTITGLSEPSTQQITTNVVPVGYSY